MKSSEQVRLWPGMLRFFDNTIAYIAKPFHLFDFEEEETEAKISTVISPLSLLKEPGLAVDTRTANETANKKIIRSRLEKIDSWE